MVIKLTKRKVLFFVLVFSSINCFSQALISIDDMITLAVCKDDIECLKPILLKNRLVANGQKEENSKITLNYYQQGTFRISTYLDIKLNEDANPNTIVLYTDKILPFEKLYLKEFENGTYKKEIDGEFTDYSKKIEDFTLRITIAETKLNNLPAKLLYISLIQNVATALEINKYAGDLLVYNENGKAIPLNTFSGKFLYLNFWSATCKYCVQELPKLKKMISELSPIEKNSFEFVLINTDENLNNWQRGIQKFGLEAFKNYNAGTNTNKNTQLAFNIDKTPKYIIIDKNGNFLSPDAPHAGFDGKKAIKYLMEKH